MENNVKRKWQIIISASDIDLYNPTTEEIIDLITASLPYNEIASHLRRLAAHIIKTIIYKKTTRNWQTTIKDASIKIRRLNTRRKAKGIYFDLTAIRKMLTEEWNAALIWVAKESEDQWTVSALKREVSISSIWKKIEILKLDQRV